MPCCAAPLQEQDPRRPAGASPAEADPVPALTDLAPPTILEGGRPRPTRRLAGTFDFRWPRGTVIRVAFQAHRDLALLDKVRGIIRDAFACWGVTGAIRQGGPALALRILEGALPAAAAGAPDPAQARLALPDGGESEVSREFAAIAGRARNARSVKPQEVSTALDYDVLISFAPMPLLIPRNEVTFSQPRVITYAQSELGTYARREDLGVPTAFVGRPESFTQGQEGVTEEDWFDDPEGRFTVVHEVGHILGLAHEHQNPRRQLSWKPQKEIEAALVPLVGRPLYKDFISTEITRRWSGALDYSDWRKPADARAGEELRQSVMAEPLYFSFVEGVAGQTGPIEYILQPTTSDLKQLTDMYPPMASEESFLGSAL